MKLEMEQRKLLQVKKKIEENSNEWKQKASNFFSLCLDATNQFLAADELPQYLFLRKITSNVLLDEKKLVVSHYFPFSEMAKRTGHERMLPDLIPIGLLIAGNLLWLITVLPLKRILKQR